MFYNKDFENNYEEIKTWYPHFYWQVLEMDAILKASGSLADGLEAGIETIFSDAFIDTADEDTIDKLEDFIGLHLYKSRTLDERRRMLKTFFLGNGKISADAIKEIVKGYTGSDVDVYFERADSMGNNRLYINYDRGSQENIYIADIDEILSRRIPAHVWYRSAMSYTFSVCTKPRRTNYSYDYPLTGLKPQISTLGLSLHPGVQVETAEGAATSLSFAYKPCGTEYAHS